MPAEGALRDGFGTGDGLGPDDGLIETLAYLPGRGAVRLARHLARLGASAKALGVPVDIAEAQRRIETLATGERPLRLRLVARMDGSLDVAATSFQPVPAGTGWRVAIARTRLDSTDALLAHKTTRRAGYEAARAEFAPEDADEVLLLNERGECCDGTITTLFAAQADGPLLTPPLSAGALSGVLRAEMIETGQTVEATLSPHDLTAAAGLFMGNSLRGLIPARLATSVQRPLL